VLSSRTAVDRQFIFRDPPKSIDGTTEKASHILDDQDIDIG